MIQIRPAKPTDVAAIGRLGALLVRTHHDFDPQRFLQATSRTADGYGSFLGSQLDEPSTIILVAERDSEVVGYAYASVEGNDYMSLRGPAGVLHDIVVDPAHRGRGVGRILLDATIEALKARGCAARRTIYSGEERRGPTLVRPCRFPANDDRDDSGALRPGLKPQASIPFISRKRRPTIHHGGLATLV